MAEATSCLEREFVIKNATVDKVVDACNKALEEMGLRTMEEEFTKDGKTIVLAAEGPLVPLMMKVLLYPLRLGDYVKAAQRSGIHVAVSPAKDGIHLFTCGIALDERTGKLADYSKEEVMEEVTDAMEAWDFEDKFINKIKAAFPNIKEIE
jgi:hypothetical protein